MLKLKYRENSIEISISHYICLFNQENKYRHNSTWLPSFIFTRRKYNFRVIQYDFLIRINLNKYKKILSVAFRAFHSGKDQELWKNNVFSELI